MGNEEQRANTKEIVVPSKVTEEVTNIKNTIKKFLELFRDIFHADACYLYLINDEMDLDEKREILNKRIKEMEETYEKAKYVNKNVNLYEDEDNLILPGKLGKPKIEDAKILKFIDVSQKKDKDGKPYWRYDYRNRPRKYVIFNKCEDNQKISEDSIIYNEGITAYIFRIKKPLINNKKGLNSHRAAASLNSSNFNSSPRIKPSSLMSIGFPLIDNKERAIGVLTIEFYESINNEITEKSKEFNDTLSYLPLLVQLIQASQPQFSKGSYQSLFGGIELLKLLKKIVISQDNPVNEKIHKDTLHLFYVLERKEYVGYEEILDRVSGYANDISNYLGLTSESKPFTDFLEKFKKHEELLLYGLSDFRDHFMHQFHVFVSGYIIINSIGIDYFKEQIEKSIELALGKAGHHLKMTEYNVLRIWFLVSFFHDHAYIFEKMGKELQNFFTSTFNQEFIVKFNWEQLIKKESVFPKHLTDLQKFFINEQRDTNPDILMRNYLDSIINSHDHGVLSALLLLNYFSEHERTDSKQENINSECENVKYTKYECLYAALAISIHNQYENLMEKNMTRISFESFPIAFLLSFCDTAQSFGRIGKKQDYRVRFSDMKFTDDRIIYELEYLDEIGKGIPSSATIEKWAKGAHNTFKSSKYFFEIKNYEVKEEKNKENENDKDHIYTLSYGFYNDTSEYYEEDVKLYNHVLKKFEDLKDKNGIATTLYQLGMIHQKHDKREEAVKLYTQALKMFEELGNKSGIATTLYQLGMIHQKQGKSEEAVELYTQARKTFKELGDKSGIATTLYQLGMIHQKQGKNEEAVELYTRVLRMFGRLMNKNGIANTLHQQGMIYQKQGNYEEAMRLYTQSLEIKEELEDKNGIATTLHQLGMIYHNKGNYEEAMKNYTQTLKMCEELGNKNGTAATLHQLGMIYQKQGNYEEAMKNYTQSLRIKENLGDKGGIATTLHQLGVIYQKQSNYEKAVKKYTQSLEIKEELGDKSGIAKTLHQLGMIHQKQGNYEEAMKKYTQTLKMFKELENKSGIAYTLPQLGMIYYNQGDYEEAMKKYTQALKIFEELGEESGVATTLHQLGMIYQKQGNYEEAMKLYTQSLETKEILGDKKGIAYILPQLGMIHQDQGNYEEAVKLYTQALKMFEELGNESGIATTLYQLGMIHQKQGKNEEAVELYTQALKTFKELGNKSGIATTLRQLEMVHQAQNTTKKP